MPSSFALKKTVNCVGDQFKFKTHFSVGGVLSVGRRQKIQCRNNCLTYIMKRVQWPYRQAASEPRRPNLALDLNSKQPRRPDLTSDLKSVTSKVTQVSDRFKMPFYYFKISSKRPVDPLQSHIFRSLLTTAADDPVP